MFQFSQPSSPLTRMTWREELMQGIPYFTKLVQANKGDAVYDDDKQ